MRMIVSALLLLFSGLALQAQESGPVEKLERDAKIMIQSIVDGDYATYIDFTYPGIIETYGGKDMMVKVTKGHKDAAASSGMILKDASIANMTSIIEGNGELQSIVTFDYVLDINGNKYKGQNFLWASSKDNGEKWTFVELETYDLESIKSFVPSYNTDLGFPEIKGAVFID